MKDEHNVLFRLAFAFVLCGALFAYAYFLYPSLRAQLSGNMHEHLALEKEKDAIAEIMLDPGLISERITDMQGQLLKTRPIKGLTPAGVTGDISRSIDRFELELQSVSLGVSEAPGGADAKSDADTPQLLSMPVTIHMKAPYDGGMYFVGSLEKSETGTYKIGSFSFELPAREAPQADAEGDDGAADAEGGADGGENPDAEELYPIYEWVITVYLLYYG